MYSLFIWNFDLTGVLYFYLPSLVTLSQETKKVLPVASHISSILNKYPHPGEKNPQGCREKQGYLNRQKHGKLSSSSCLQQLEGHGDDSPLETQPKQSFFFPDQFLVSCRRFQRLLRLLTEDTILNVACNARNVVWVPAQCSFSQSYYKEVVMKQNESMVENCSADPKYF